jgi:hypothetical protein
MPTPALHGFLRAPDASFTKFDAPGATCGFSFGTCTEPNGINAAGEIAGLYCDAVTCHGFLRASGGAIVTVDPDGSIFTQVNALNSPGTATGTYLDANFAGMSLDCTALS